MHGLLRGFSDELMKLANPTAIAPIHADIDLKDVLKDVRREAKAAPDDPEVRGSFAKLRSKGRPVTRDYLVSTLLGATLTPLAVLAGRGIFRGLRNREVRQAMRGMTRTQATGMQKELRAGPLVGREVPFKRPRIRREPLISYPALAAAAGTGGLYGSVFQMIRDRFAGSAGAPKSSDTGP